MVRHRIKVLLAGVLLLVLVFPRPARADPHAVFYTAIGQQQLFFNVLAALNQADFVEPATNTTGTSSGVSREEILQKRTEQGFAEESAPVVTSTETQLGSILTRGITLEGNDLWTAYIAYQNAIEADRRRNLVELLEFFCNIAIGVDECSEEESEDSPQVLAARKERSFVVDPIKEQQEIDNTADAALLPAIAFTFDQQQRIALIDQASLEHNNFRPYNKNAAQLAQRSGNNAKAQGVLSRWINSAVHFSTGGINPVVLDNITSTGDIAVPDDATAQDLTNKLSAFLGAGNQILASHIATQEQKQYIDNTKTVNGINTLTRPVPEGGNGIITDVNEQLAVPVAARLAQVDTTIQAVSDAEVNRYAVETEQNIQGDTEFTERSSGSGSVEGLTTRDGTQEGEVLGTVAAATTGGTGGIPNQEDVGPERPPTDLIDVAEGPTSFTREPIIEQLLNLLAGGRTSGGCGCSLDDVINGYGP